MGRPPMGERALSDAERQRRHRERLRQNRPPTEIETLRQRVAELEAQLAATPRPKAGAGDSMLWETLRALKRENDALKRAAPAAQARANAALKEALARAEARLADAPSETAKLARQLKAAQTRIRNLTVAARQNPTVISKRDHRKLLRCLYPDTASRVSERQRTEASQIFNALPFNFVDDEAASGA